MSVRQQSKHELAAAVQRRYLRASRAEKGQILDEFVAATGYHRKRAVRLLRHGPPPVRSGHGGRPRVCTAVVGGALRQCAEASDWLCGKRLAPFLDELVPALEAEGVLHVTPAVRTALRDCLPRPLTVGALAIRNYVRDIKVFASWLSAEHYTAGNVCAAIRLPKAYQTPIPPFSDDDLSRIFGCLDTADAFDLRDYVILHTLFDTGMRVGELVVLTVDDVDLRGCQIRIAHAKFGKWRDIGFGRETHKYLTRYLSLCRPELVLPGKRHLFLSFDGYPIPEATVQKICARLSKRCGVHIHCHRFRHTFAVNMLRAGTNLRTLQRLMGHADIRILARYLNLASDEAIKTHQTNSPADRFASQQQSRQRLLPMRRPDGRQEWGRTRA